MRYFSNFPYARIGLLSIGLLICIFTMGHFTPDPAPEPFSSPIIALEFVNSYAGLDSVFFLLSSEEIYNIRTATKVDFIFMIFYSLFLFLFVTKTSSLSGSSFLAVFKYCPAIILVADFVENIQIFRMISKYLDGAPEAAFGSILQYLQISTWLKWDLLALVLLGLFAGLWKMGTLARILGTLCTVPFLLLLMAVFLGNFWINAFAQSISLAFGLLVVFCFIYKKEAQPSA